MVMKTNEVKILLQKYYEGLTTSEEESALEQYFMEGPSDPEFEADRLHFEAMASMRDEEIPVPEDLETAVLSRLHQVQKTRPLQRRKIVYFSMSIAAGLLLLASTFIFLSRKDPVQGISDPKLAYAETRQALEMVSRYINEGTSKLSGLNKMNQAVEPLSHFNSLDKVAKTIAGLGKVNNQK